MTNSELIKKVQGNFLQKGRQTIRTGMEVEVYQKLKEGNKERIQRFKGIVIKTAGKSELERTITVRRKIGAFGVEKIFTIHSSTIEKIEIIRQFKVRRKSIKFIRELTGKAARLKEIPLKNVKEIEVPEETPAKVEVEKVEVVVVEKETPEVKEEVKAEEKTEEKVPEKEKVEKVEEEKKEDSKEEK